MRLHPATHLVVMCRTEQQAQQALSMLRVIPGELGLTVKDAKTRIVELRDGGDDALDFLGFSHRWVRGNTLASKHLAFLVRWPSDQAMRRARQRVREMTDRRRLREPPEDVVRDLNRFLRGWAGYFRYGNSAVAFEKIDRHAYARLAAFVAKRHKRRTRYGWGVLAATPDRMGLISLTGTVIPPRPFRSRHREH